MTRRPILCLNGKPTRYRSLSITTNIVERGIGEWIILDSVRIVGASVSYGRRPSGRRIIWVHVPEVDDEG